MLSSTDDRCPGQSDAQPAHGALREHICTAGEEGRNICSTCQTGRLLLRRAQRWMQSPAEDDRDAVSTWLCIGRIIVYSCERSAPDVHLLPPLRCCACEYLCCSVHQKVAQDPPRLLAQGAKAGTPVLCIAPRPEETQQPRLFRAFSTQAASPCRYRAVQISSCASRRSSGRPDHGCKERAAIH